MQRGEHFGFVPVYLHPPEDFLDLAVGIDDESGAFRPHVGPPIVVLLLPGVVELVGHQVLVAEKREIQGILVDELRVRFQGVFTHPQDHRVETPELWEIVPECACLPGASGCIVRWIEVENDALSFHGAKFHRSPRRRGQLEVWCPVPFAKFPAPLFHEGCRNGPAKKLNVGRGGVAKVCP